MPGQFNISPNKEFSMKTDGFSGIFYKSPYKGTKNKVLIILCGSSGGRISMVPVAGYFSKRGLDCMIVDYYGRDGLPKDLKNMPVEVVGNAAEWLRNEGYKKVGVYGISMGTVIATLAAAAFPELISCLILVSPMYMVTQAEKRNDSGVLDGSSFALYGKPYPYAKWGMSSLKFNLTYYRDCLIHRDLYCKNIVERAYSNCEDTRAILPVEKARASILFVSGSLDSMIPTDDTCRKFMKILDENDYPYTHKHLNYEHLGHAIVPFRSPVLKAFRSERMFPVKGDKEKKQSYREITRFLKYNW